MSAMSFLGVRLGDGVSEWLIRYRWAVVLCMYIHWRRLTRLCNYAMKHVNDHVRDTSISGFNYFQSKT